MAATYRAEIRTPVDVAPGDNAQKYFENLSADPTATNGTGVNATTATGTVFVPMHNVLAIIKTN